MFSQGFFLVRGRREGQRESRQCGDKQRGIESGGNGSRGQRWRFEDAALLAPKSQEGTVSQGKQAASGSGKDKERDLVFGHPHP